MGSCHQGQLCSIKLFQRIGKFDTSFKIDMDYDFILLPGADSVTDAKVTISEPITAAER